MRHLIALVCLLFAGLPAAAEVPWETFENPETGLGGAVVCPRFDAANGQFLCLELSCHEGGDLGWTVSVGGSRLPQALTVFLDVDGRPAGELEMTRTATPDHAEFEAAFDSDAHPRLVELLRGGAAANLTLAFDEMRLSQPLTLLGSSLVLGAALDRCDMPTAPAIRDPGAEVLAEVRALCADVGGEVEVQDGFIREIDIDGDGLMDREINYGAAQCSTAYTLYCGSAGCLTALYRNRGDGSFDRVFADNYYGVEVQTRTVLTFQLHGSACGLAGAQACRKSFGWQDGRLVPLD